MDIQEFLGLFAAGLAGSAVVAAGAWWSLCFIAGFKEGWGLRKHEDKAKKLERTAT
jgi:hypothetical protein